MTIPLYELHTAGVKEKEIEDLEEGISKILKEMDFSTLVSGAIMSTYQKSRIDQICKHLNLESFSPLWQNDPWRVLEEEISTGFQFILSSCSAAGLSKEWLGKRFDRVDLKVLKDLSEKYGFSPVFEGGEGETFVTDGPIFKQRIEIVDSERRWDLDQGQYIIKSVRLVNK
jgi:predicted ATP pyrophosphatase (TIGR00289 family)